jgi:hypothetical protein
VENKRAKRTKRGPTLRHPSEATPAYKRGMKAEAQRRGMAATRKKSQAERTRRKKIIISRDQQRRLDDMYNSPQGQLSRERMRRGI